MKNLKYKEISLSIVIPAYNEEKMIKTTVQSAYRTAKKITRRFEIVVLNDKSTDKTLEILQSIKYRELKIINHKKNLGIEKSVRDLYNTAKKDLIFFNGADGDIDMAVLLKLFKKMVETNADIVVGNRVIKNYSLKRSIVSNLYNDLVKMLIGVNAYDAGTVKLVKKRYFSNLKVDSKSVFGEAERLVRSVKRGARLEKVDIKQNLIEANDAIDYREIILCGKDLINLVLKVRLNLLKY